MKIPLKHNLKCIDCQYQEKINEACEGLPFGIEWDYFKAAGDVVIDTFYTIHYGEKRMQIIPPFEVTEYKRNEPINLINRLSDNGIKTLVQMAEDEVRTWLI